MNRTVLGFGLLAALALVGLAVFSLRGDEKPPPAPRADADSRAGPEKVAAATAARPMPQPPRMAAPEPEPESAPVARSPEPAPVAVVARAKPAELDIDPAWSPVLKSSASSCQQVIERLDKAIADGAALSSEQRENLLAAAVDNVNWLRDFVDAKDAAQVATLASARATLEERLQALQLQLPRDAGKL